MALIKTALRHVRSKDPALQPFIDAVLGLTRTWNGEAGNPLDRVLTLRDFAENTEAKKFLSGVPADTGVAAVLPAPSGDRTPPQQLSNLIVANGPTKNVLSWDGTFQANYAHTEIWRHTADSLANAVMVGHTRSNVFSDDVGDIGTTYYYWIRAVSPNDVAGPFNATAGTSATVSAVDSAHIANAAIVSAKIGDAQITNAKIDRASANKLIVVTADIQNAAITQAKIANLAVDTAQIANAAISNAKIGTAAVDTLQLAGQAVSIPVSSYVSGQTNLGGFTSPTTAATLTMTCTGNPVNIHFSCIAWIEGGEFGSDAFAEVYRDSTVIWSADSIMQTGVYYDLMGASCAINLQDTPSAGSHTYTVKMWRGSGSGVNGNISRRALVCTEMKR